jgi:hypothetical protein
VLADTTTLTSLNYALEDDSNDDNIIHIRTRAKGAPDIIKGTVAWAGIFKHSNLSTVDKGFKEFFILVHN